MRKTFDAELQELNYEMIDMAAAAEDAIDVVTESLASGDDAAAKSAVEMTRSMDQMERDIENRCLRLLLQQQPVARDLRTISAAMKMVTDLQRIGDQCANIAEISLLLDKRQPVPSHIREMSSKASGRTKAKKHFFIATPPVFVHFHIYAAAYGAMRKKPPRPGGHGGPIRTARLQAPAIGRSAAGKAASASTRISAIFHRGCGPAPARPSPRRR